MPDDGRTLRPRAAGAARLIQRYEEIAEASRGMAAAARAERWDLVAQHEARCKELIAEVKAAGRMQQLSDTEQRRRIELLRGILAADAEMRARAEPWLRQLEQMIGKAASSRKLPPAAR